MQVVKKTLVTEDEYLLSFSLYKPIRPSSDVIVVGSALGTLQYYYSKYAKYTCETYGVNVITFDYRGIGESLNSDIKKCQATLSDWAIDLKAILRWSLEQNPNVFLLGHSVTGQLLPFTEIASQLKAVYLVASQTASYYYWEGRSRLKVKFFWYFILPFFVRVFGYIPGWVMGGADIPKNVALEWKKWGTHREGAMQGRKELRELYKKVSTRIHFLNISDDEVIAPKSATEQLMKTYISSRTTFEELVPSDAGLEEVGHFGFFRSKMREKLWDRPMQYFKEVA